MAVLQEGGFDTASIGVVGIEVGSPQQPEGYVPYKTWSYVVEQLPTAKFTDISRAFCDLILVKCEEELELARYSAQVGERACEALLSIAKPGVSESEMAAVIMKKILGSGAGTRMPHLILHTGVNNLSWGAPSWVYQAQSHRRMEKGNTLLYEIFVVYGGIETQPQMCLALEPVDCAIQECAEVARRSYEIGPNALRPGKASIKWQRQWVNRSRLLALDSIDPQFESNNVGWPNERKNRAGARNSAGGN